MTTPLQPLPAAASATEIPWLAGVIPAWMRLWFSLFPTVQTLTAQAFAAVLVLGSYVAARRQS
jgi:high-affinity iron transporter